MTEEEVDGYRYRLLEPMRQYARERLVEAGEMTSVAARHLAFYLELARAADPERAAAGPIVGLNRLAADHDNLRAALGWALRHEPEQALALAVHMWPMWMAGSHFQEGSRWLDAALAAAPTPTELRAQALRAACGLRFRLGRTDGLSELGAERVAIFRALGDRGAVAHALDEAGVYEYTAGRYDRAERLYAQSRALAEELNDGRVLAAVRHSEGVLAQCRGDFAGAREALLDSLTRLRELPAGDGDRFFRVHTVGLFVAAEGPGGAPRMYFEETAQFFRRVDARRAVGYVLAGLGDVARAQGLIEPARERLAESLAHFREARDAMGTAFALNRLGNLAGATGQHELGREWLEEALALRRELGDRRAVGMTLGNLGVLTARAGDVERGPLAAGRSAGAVRGDRRRARADGDAAQPRQPRRGRRRARGCARAARGEPATGRTAAPGPLRGLGDAHAGRAGDRRRRRRARRPTARRGARAAAAARRPVGHRALLGARSSGR